ncbi:OmpA family protein [Psychroserpens damuponensis]|uniref:OmpA family protein n=1 Tax=Psychroserpens damuponensis TaxID=943936 RepID=UPI0006948663|nr:OmpA family protein [Psychroserpens damuponensis]
MAQNLVLNPSFEAHSSYKCLVNLGGFDQSILKWSIPNYGSTDFFDSCSQVMGINNYNGFQKPKSGTSYAGMYLYTNDNYREYVQGQLSKTLIKGEKYKMTFYLSLADKSSYVLTDINVLITEEKLKPCYHSNRCEKVIKPSKATEGKFKMYSHSEEIYFANKETWMEYSFEFIADGYENYFSIGNFYRNTKTKKQTVLSTSEFYFSYYYIDDVSLKSLEKAQKEAIIVEDKPIIENNTIYTFKNVLFEFDKSKLLPNSITEIEDLYQHLLVHPNLKVEIYGHTDAVGLATRNEKLSNLRAKAVSDYLITLGLKKSRIKFFGFGSSKPVATNNTKEGQELNRRVEFKLIDSN